MAKSNSNSSSSVDRLMEFARKAVHKEWGYAQSKLGGRIQRALLAEEVLRLVAMQSDEVSDAKVRELAVEGWLKVMEAEED